LWTFNHTQSGLLHAAYDMVDNWNGGLEATKGKFGKEFQLISPQSSNAVRLRWEGAAIDDAKQLAKWESELGDDPVGWLTLGQKYYALNDLDAATRCYRRSLDISPCYDATVGLANCYYYNGKKELWQPTLETYLEVQDLGLAHAQIHQLIAEERISERAWSEAEEHALEAAGTYSAWGLALASRSYEGKQDWEKSEHFIAEAAKHYPSSSAGTSWYFWCQRTGRGDIDEARALAERSAEIAEGTTYYNEACRAFVYRLLEGDASAAIAGLEKQLAKCTADEAVWDKAWRLLHTVAAAKATEKGEQLTESITQLRSLAETEIKTTDPEWEAVIDGLCRAFEGQELDAEFLKKYDETITNGSADGRCNYQYFMGVALDSQGRAEQADDYWRRAAFGGPFANFNATLAGHRLVERHGPERGGIPAELAERDAKQEAAAQAAAEADTESDDEGAAAAGANDRSI
jgi:tetratricopeptide (TPR) repeat protein